jgi:very-short-patch-repair endonuclease
MHDVERRIDALAVAQEQVASRAQLLAAGLGRGALAHRLSTRRYRRMYQAIYLLGYGRPTFRQWLWATLLLGGSGAALSHRTAAGLWRMLPTNEDVIDVSLPDRFVRPRHGLRIHRTRIDLNADVVALGGLAVTSPVRTVCDLVVSEATEVAEAALTEALVHRQLPAGAVRALEGRLVRHVGAAKVRRLLAAEQEFGYTRSAAERRLRALLAGSGLPMPRFNELINGHLVDCHWPVQRLLLEVDAFGTHGDRRSFERDRRRDQDHLAAGYRVIRITWRQLVQEPGRVLVRIAQTLAML